LSIWCAFDVTVISAFQFAQHYTIEHAELSALHDSIENSIKYSIERSKRNAVFGAFDDAITVSDDRSINSPVLYSIKFPKYLSNNFTQQRSYIISIITTFFGSVLNSFECAQQNTLISTVWNAFDDTLVSSLYDTIERSIDNSYLYSVERSEHSA